MEAATAVVVVLVLPWIASITSPKQELGVALEVMPVMAVKELALRVPHLVAELLELLVAAAAAVAVAHAIRADLEAAAELVCMDKARTVAEGTSLIKDKAVLEDYQLL
jgi:hypothetical protein